MGDGRSALFWSDSWLHGCPLHEIAPYLCQAVPAKLRRTRTVADALHNNNWRKDITGSLSIPILIDYVRLRQATDAFPLNPEISDKISWRWSPTGEFSVSSAYQALFIGQTGLPGARELWTTRAPNKCRFFFWLVLHNKVWTAERCRRHGLQAHGDCALCSQSLEELDHLLVQCVFSREVWFKALRKYGWQSLAPGQNDSFILWWLRARKAVSKVRRKAFDSFIVLVGWHLWLERNARTFRNVTASVSSVLSSIAQATEQWCLAKLLSRVSLYPT